MIYMALETRFPNMSVIEDPLFYEGEIMNQMVFECVFRGQRKGRFIIGLHLAASVGALIGRTRFLSCPSPHSLNFFQVFLERD